VPEPTITSMTATGSVAVVAAAGDADTLHLSRVSAGGPAASVSRADLLKVANTLRQYFGSRRRRA
jgi:hypothetical protein